MVASPATSRNAISVGIVGAWVLLMIVAVGLPWLFDPSLLGDRLIRYTVRLSLLCYLLALLVMLRLERGDWTAETPIGAAARWLWTLGWLTFVIHLGMAFHFAHGWSHSSAMQHTERASGVGEGIFVSHLFTLLWTLDAVYWQLRPGRYASRAKWIERSLHAFMLFMVFNGAVVFESGFIRYAGLAGFALLGAAYGFSRRSESPATSPRFQEA